MVPDNIEREVLVDAPPEVVWSVVTDARHVAEWFSDAAEIDLRPGGRVVLTWHGHGTCTGHVVTLDRPHTFAFRWLRREAGEAEDQGSTLVELTLTPVGDRTRLRVTESGFPDLPWPEGAKETYVSENERGWSVELRELQEYVSAMAGRTAR